VVETGLRSEYAEKASFPNFYNMANRGIEEFTTNSAVIEAVREQPLAIDDLSDEQLSEVVDRIEANKDRVGVHTLARSLIETTLNFTFETEPAIADLQKELDDLVSQLIDKSR